MAISSLAIKTRYFEAIQPERFYSHEFFEQQIAGQSIVLRHEFQKTFLKFHVENKTFFIF